MPNLAQRRQRSQNKNHGDFTVSLSIAKRHMGSNKSPEVTGFGKQTTIGQKPLLPTFEDRKIGILNNISTFKNQSQVPTYSKHCNIISIGSCDCTRVSHVGLLNLILKQGLVGASDLLQLNESKIKRHINGKNILKTQIVLREVKVNWVLFRDIKFARDVKGVVYWLF